MADPQQPLAIELKTYEQHKDELLQHGEGKYVLIAGETIIGTYDTKLDAVAAGHQQVGPGPFLVKKIERVEKPVRILVPGYPCAFRNDQSS
jgi:hypothetical protein